uniref:Tick transposon n=1 Tax=Rhipicephalus appendiculatus TaxID=34631 RepID=A0A131YZC1_RHIAP
MLAYSREPASRLQSEPVNMRCVTSLLQHTMRTVHLFHSQEPSLRLATPSGLPRSEPTVLCRMCLGVSFTNAFACRIRWAEDAACEHCGTDETIERVLCHCPQYSSQIRSFAGVFARLDDQSLSEKSILKCRGDRVSRMKATKALLKFLRATRLVERL